MPKETDETFIKFVLEYVKNHPGSTWREILEAYKKHGEKHGEKVRKNFNSALYQLLGQKKIEKRDPKPGSLAPTWYPAEGPDDDEPQYSFTKI